MTLTAVLLGLTVWTVLAFVVAAALGRKIAKSQHEVTVYHFAHEAAEAAGARQHAA